jgi:hypothetical protein
MVVGEPVAPWVWGRSSGARMRQQASPGGDARPRPRPSWLVSNRRKQGALPPLTCSRPVRSQRPQCPPPVCGPRPSGRTPLQ